MTSLGTRVGQFYLDMIVLQIENLSDVVSSFLAILPSTNLLPLPLAPMLAGVVRTLLPRGARSTLIGRPLIPRSGLSTEVTAATEEEPVDEVKSVSMVTPPDLP